MSSQTESDYNSQFMFSQHKTAGLHLYSVQGLLHEQQLKKYTFQF
jgi:hypothetical protein